MPIDRDKLWSTGTLESEDEKQHQRSRNFFGDFGVYTSRFGEWHFKPVVLDFTTDMNKFKQSANSAGRLLTREEEVEHKTQQTRGLNVTQRRLRSSGFIWDSQAAWFQSTEEKDKWKLAYKIDSSGNYTPNKMTLEPENKSDRVWTAASSLALPARFKWRNDIKLGGMVRYRTRFRDKDKTEIDAAGKSRYAGEAKDRYRISEDYYALFLQDRIRFTDRLSLLPGIRTEYVRLESATPQTAAEPRYFLDINPSGHLLHRITDRTSLRASASRGLARPKFDELFPFENESAAKIVIGNPDLEPARAWSYDIGIDHATNMVTLSVTAFRKTLRGVIEEVDTGLNRGTRDIYQVRNVGNGWLRGIETEERFRMPSEAPNWAKGFSFWANQTILSSQLRQADGKVRPFKDQPRWIANFGIDFGSERLGNSISVISNFIARRYDFKPSGDVSSHGGLASFDLAVHQRIRGNWRFFFEINNLANRVRSQDEMLANGTYSRRIEAYGRTILSGIQASF